MKILHKLFSYNKGISAIYLCFVEALGNLDLRGKD